MAEWITKELILFLSGLEAKLLESRMSQSDQR